MPRRQRISQCCKNKAAVIADAAATSHVTQNVTASQNAGGAASAASAASFSCFSCFSWLLQLLQLLQLPGLEQVDFRPQQRLGVQGQLLHVLVLQNQKVDERRNVHFHPGLPCARR